MDGSVGYLAPAPDRHTGNHGMQCTQPTDRPKQPLTALNLDFELDTHPPPLCGGTRPALLWRRGLGGGRQAVKTLANWRRRTPQTLCLLPSHSPMTRPFFSFWARVCEVAPDGWVLVSVSKSITQYQQDIDQPSLDHPLPNTPKKRRSNRPASCVLPASCCATR